MDATRVNQFETAEELLVHLRKGNTTKFEIGYDGWKIPCRLLSASEMLRLQIRTSQRARAKNPMGDKPELFEAVQGMICILDAATTIQGAPTFTDAFLESLPERILSDLYDQFLTINNTVNPDIQLMKPEDIQQIVEDVKKKKTVAKDYYTWQLAEVGKFFLDVLIPNLPTDKEAGSPS